MRSGSAARQEVTPLSAEEGLRIASCTEKNGLSGEMSRFTPALESAGRTSVQGSVMSVSSQAVRFALRTGSMMVLARLLTAEDFGLQAMVLVTTGFLALFRDAGLSAVTVQRDNLSHDQVSTLFWINAAVGSVVCVARRHRDRLSLDGGTGRCGDGAGRLSILGSCLDGHRDAPGDRDWVLGVTAMDAWSAQAPSRHAHHAFDGRHVDVEQHRCVLGV